MSSFALIGAAGYVAPRHLKAIRETGHELVAAYDPADSVGVLDGYFPETAFFTEFERFDRHLDKIHRAGKGVEYVSICSPNYLHDAHIRFGLRNGAHVICEKPLVLNPWNVEALKVNEAESGKRVSTILQLRLHPSIIGLREKVHSDNRPEKHEVDLSYITSRGSWYYTSWKGDVQKSGGIATNIGIHFFDMLSWIFGPVMQNIVHIHTHDRAAGFLEFQKARVRWFLSINAHTLPQEAAGKRTYRAIHIDGENLEFSEGFTDLHTLSYQDILAGNGFGLDDALPAIQLAHDIRTSRPIGLINDYHPLARLPLEPHPFS